MMKSVLFIGLFIASSLFSQIRVVKPNGGERWKADTVQQIIIYINAAAEGPYFDFYYSVDNCRTWKYIDSGYYYGNYTYDWDVPDDPSQFCFVKAYATMSGNWDTSDHAFTIYNEQTGFREYEKNAFCLPCIEFKPNPFSKCLYLILPDSTSIYSLTGHLILKLDKGKYELDTSKWRNGVYIIKSGNEIKKIVKID
ncbi:MAG: T9SS type A sorting domain-containing protein [Candidatus Coatesbacteria bacterium]|nr:T9SS type A sorting domain-containing protein [Candidatus Coatesbacteria bacterium]